MTNGNLSEALRDFLMEHVHSFEDLEVLLLARRLRDQSLGAETVASSVNIDPALATEALNHLSSEGLLIVVSSAPLEYQYGPSAALAAFVDELAKAYDEQRLSIVTAVASNAIVRVRTSAIRTFAQAFMLRKGPKK